MANVEKTKFPMENSYGRFETEEDWDNFCLGMIDYYKNNKYTGD